MNKLLHALLFMLYVRWKKKTFLHKKLPKNFKLYFPFIYSDLLRNNLYLSIIHQNVVKKNRHIWEKKKVFHQSNRATLKIHRPRSYNSSALILFTRTFFFASSYIQFTGFYSFSFPNETFYSHHNIIFIYSTIIEQRI